MKYRIQPLHQEHLSEVAQIHLRAFQNTFLTSMGLRFLCEYYQIYLCSPVAVALTSVDDSSNRVVGFVTGTEDVELLYGQTFRSQLFQLAGASIIRCFETPKMILQLWQRRSRVVKPLFNKFLKISSHPNTTFSCLPRASLTSIAVDPDYQRQNIASELLCNFMDELRDRNITSVKLGVEKSNEAACRFYQKMGWKLNNDASNGESLIYYFDF